MTATDLNWRQNSHRYVFLIADAPPHGSEYSSCSDNYPNGCPCNIKLDDIVKKFKEMKISLIFCTVDGEKPIILMMSLNLNFQICE